MPDNGQYESFMNNNPHYNMNDKNATILNSKNPVFFAEAYEKTLMKQMQQADQIKINEQIKNANEAQNNLK